MFVIAGARSEIILIPTEKGRIRVDIFNIDNQFEVYARNDHRMVVERGKVKTELIQAALARLDRKSMD
ncbi:hypothetical protein [Litchfieldia salsa]|uniref:Uncharacterized protein n=1 Tax=Litchfieldia salsa TaxID=930152 RepID=A0A1H0W6Y8_9BACI|nr:hypothetical protein [Litchfieldia salsa]SDP86510.1 hypothetical protein SAMN05216565_109144 [Litchfieldia salsa]